jgi:hypothetical protein
VTAPPRRPRGPWWPLLPAALAALAAALPPAARAEPAAACHCFRDRTWDPARPAAADPYVLATARSSLLSATHGVPKRTLVAAVMGGTPAEDLWVARWAGARLGRDPDELLEARRARGGWREALAGAAGPLPPAFGAALRAGGDPAALAAVAVDDVLVARLGLPAAALAGLRATGAPTEHVVLAAVLERHLGAPARPLLAEVRAGRTSWGRVLHDAGLAPRDLDGLIRGLVR